MQPTKSILPLPFWLYLVLWCFFLYLFICIFSFQVDQPTNIFISSMYFIQFGVHEISHLVVFFLPPIFVAAAGSFGEIGFTILLVLAALKAKAYFAAIFSSLWVMLAMNSVGRYMADARSQIIPLVGPGDTVKHDWHYIFEQLGWLNQDILLGTVVRGLGDLVGIVALSLGIWLLFLKLTE